MRGIITRYNSLPSTMYCSCDGNMVRIHTSAREAVFRCDSCSMIAKYDWAYSGNCWMIAKITRPDKSLAKPDIDKSILSSVLLKLDAIANHLGVELVNVPEQYECATVEDKGDPQ